MVGTWGRGEGRVQKLPLRGMGGGEEKEGERGFTQQKWKIKTKQKTQQHNCNCFIHLSGKCKTATIYITNVMTALNSTLHFCLKNINSYSAHPGFIESMLTPCYDREIAAYRSGYSCEASWRNLSVLIIFFSVVIHLFAWQCFPPSPQQSNEIWLSSLLPLPLPPCSSAVPPVFI